MSETRSVEASGTDIEEAIEAGLKQLEVSRESVIVEILEEPSRGFLGVGSKFATVRLTTAARPRSEATPVATQETSGVVSLPKVRPVGEGEYPEDILIGKEKLETLLGMMDINGAQVVVEVSETANEEDKTYVLQVQGSNLRTLIGRKGDTLNALQYITRLVASRDLQRRADFIVDVGGYKANRATKLYRLANRMANQAVERRRTVKLEPMPPHERRIIHMALRQRDDVSTSSVGEGKYRKVTIIPRID
jgi:spoIIIJ-associated protein